MRHVIFSSLSSPAVPCSSTLSHLRHDFRGGEKVWNIKCVFLFSVQLLFETFLILRIIQRDIVTNVKTSSCKLPDTFVRVYWNLKFLDRFSKNTEVWTLIKIRLAWADCFHADRHSDRQTDRQTRGWTDMTKLILAFRNFANTPKNVKNGQNKTVWW